MVLPTWVMLTQIKSPSFSVVVPIVPVLSLVLVSTAMLGFVEKILDPFLRISTCTVAPVGETFARKLPVLISMPYGIVTTAPPVAVTFNRPSTNHVRAAVGDFHSGALVEFETRMLPVAAVCEL